MKSSPGQKRQRLSLAALSLCTIIIFGSSCGLFNPPVIESLTAKQLVLKQGMSTPIECVASDPDGHELSYQWTATGGDISGQGSIVIWTAPDVPDSYVIIVKVTDGRGGKVSKELNVWVRPPG